MSKLNENMAETVEILFSRRQLELMNGFAIALGEETFKDSFMFMEGHEDGSIAMSMLDPSKVESMIVKIKQAPPRAQIFRTTLRTREVERFVKSVAKDDTIKLTLSDVYPGKTVPYYYHAKLTTDNIGSVIPAEPVNIAAFWPKLDVNFIREEATVRLGDVKPALTLFPKGDMVELHMMKSGAFRLVTCEDNKGSANNNEVLMVGSKTEEDVIIKYYVWDRVCRTIKAIKKFAKLDHVITFRANTSCPLEIIYNTEEMEIRNTIAPMVPSED